LDGLKEAHHTNSEERHGQHVHPRHQIEELGPIAMIALHNLLDGLKPESFGGFAWLWGILHGGYSFKVTSGFEFRPLYPLIPWVGVMAAGYSFGSLLLWPPNRRRRALLWLGLGLTAAFVLSELPCDIWVSTSSAFVLTPRPAHTG